MADSIDSKTAPMVLANELADIITLDHTVLGDTNGIISTRLHRRRMLGDDIYELQLRPDLAAAYSVPSRRRLMQSVLDIMYRSHEHSKTGLEYCSPSVKGMVQVLDKNHEIGSLKPASDYYRLPWSYLDINANDRRSIENDEDKSELLNDVSASNDVYLRAVSCLFKDHLVITTKIECYNATRHVNCRPNSIIGQFAREEWALRVGSTAPRFEDYHSDYIDDGGDNYPYKDKLYYFLDGASEYRSSPMVYITVTWPIGDAPDLSNDDLKNISGINKSVLKKMEGDQKSIIIPDLKRYYTIDVSQLRIGNHSNRGSRYYTVPNGSIERKSTVTSPDSIDPDARRILVNFSNSAHDLANDIRLSLNSIGDDREDMLMRMKRTQVPDTVKNIVNTFLDNKNDKNLNTVLRNDVELLEGQLDNTDSLDEVESISKALMKMLKDVQHYENKLHHMGQLLTGWMNIPDDIGKALDASSAQLESMKKNYDAGMGFTE